MRCKWSHARFLQPISTKLLNKIIIVIVVSHSYSNMKSQSNSNKSKILNNTHFCLYSHGLRVLKEGPTLQQNNTAHTYIALSLVPNELYRIGPAWLVLLTGTHISICSTWAGRGDRLGGRAAFSVTSESFTATASSNGKSAQLHLYCACRSECVDCN